MERRSGRTQRLIAASAVVFTLAVAAVGAIGLFSLAGDAERVRADALAAAEPLARELGEVLDRLATELAADPPAWAIGFRTDELGTLLEPTVGGPPRRSNADELVAGITRVVDALDRAGDTGAGDQRLEDVAARDDRPELAAWALAWLAARTDDPRLARERRERLVQDFPDVRDGRGLRLAFAARADLLFGHRARGGERTGGDGPGADDRAASASAEGDGLRSEHVLFDDPPSELEPESARVERTTWDGSPPDGSQPDASAAAGMRSELASGADRIAALFELYADILADRRSLDDRATTYLAERVAERILVLDPKRAAQVAIARATADRPLELFADWSLGASDWIARGAPNGAVLLAGAASPRGARVLAARSDGSGGYVGAAVELSVVASLALERAGAAQWRELGFEARVLEAPDRAPVRDMGAEAGRAFAPGVNATDAGTGSGSVLDDGTRDEGSSGATAESDGAGGASARRIESNGRGSSDGASGGNTSGGSASGGSASSNIASRISASGGSGPGNGKLSNGTSSTNASDGTPLSGTSLNGTSSNGTSSNGAAWNATASGGAAADASDRGAPVATARPGTPFETLRPSVRALDFAERVRAEERRFLFALVGFLVALALAGAAGFTVVRTARLEGRRAREREDFVAAVTHELKTPVASIRLMAELLERGDAPPERARDFARRTVLESERLERLVDSVLRFAGTTRGGRLRDLAAIDLAEVLETARASVQPLADERGFELRTAAVPTGLFVRAELDALVGAIGELLDNATKYGAAAAGVDVAASVRGDHVRLEVHDRGPGVPEAERERVFEPFRRLGDELTRERRGIGLGLALVRATAESFGGAAGYRARAGGGASLWIELERAEAPSDVARAR